MGIAISWLASVREMSRGSLDSQLVNGQTQLVWELGAHTFVNHIRALGLAFFALGGILEMVNGGSRRLPLHWIIFGSLAVMYASAWFLFEPEGIRSVFQLGTVAYSPITWMMLIGAPTGANERNWPVIDRVLATITFSSIALAIWFTFQLPEHTVRFAGYNPRTVFLVYAFWGSLYLSLNFKPTQALYSFAILFSFMACSTIAIMMQARGWLLLSVFGLILFSARVGTTYRMGRFCVLGLIGSASVALIYVASIYFAPSFDALFSRLGEDTRSIQYQLFFQDTRIWELLVGGGSFATYAGETWIDNQVLMTLLHFGLPVLFGYFVVALLPGLRVAKYRTFMTMWIVALLGVSTYMPLALTPNNYLVLLLGARCAAARVKSGKLVRK